MYNMKRIGPKIDPCGTPHSILKKDDDELTKPSCHIFVHVFKIFTIYSRSSFCRSLLTEAKQ